MNKSRRANLLPYFNSGGADFLRWLMLRLILKKNSKYMALLEILGFLPRIPQYVLNSPYSASEAGSDHFVRAYGETYSILYIILSCSINYGQINFQKI